MKLIVLGALDYEEAMALHSKETRRRMFTIAPCYGLLGCGYWAATQKVPRVYGDFFRECLAFTQHF